MLVLEAELLEHARTDEQEDLKELDLVARRFLAQDELDDLLVAELIVFQVEVDHLAEDGLEQDVALVQAVGLGVLEVPVQRVDHELDHVVRVEDELAELQVRLLREELLDVGDEQLLDAQLQVLESL